MNVDRLRLRCVEGEIHRPSELVARLRLTHQWLVGAYFVRFTCATFAVSKSSSSEAFSPPVIAIAVDDGRMRKYPTVRFHCEIGMKINMKKKVVNSVAIKQLCLGSDERDLRLFLLQALGDTPVTDGPFALPLPLLLFLQRISLDEWTTR